MNFHLVSLAHSQTTGAWTFCGFTSYVRTMSRMLSELGHKIYIYGSEECDVPCTELVTCITKAEQFAVAGIHGHEWRGQPDCNPSGPLYSLFNSGAVDGIRNRIGPNDIVLISQGLAHQPVLDAFPKHTRCEYAIGYGGLTQTGAHRAFLSSAWMHFCYAKSYGEWSPMGRFLDRVIPVAFDPAEFPMGQRKTPPYLAFLGRWNVDKGCEIACDVAKVLGLPLVVGGSGDFRWPSWVEVRGRLMPDERARLMGEASAVLVPSLYMEPFGSIAVEAQLCGTPSVTTDWGGYTETVPDLWRCHSFDEFCAATTRALELTDVDRLGIRDAALARFSMAAIGPRYVRYFEELLQSHGSRRYG